MALLIFCLPLCNRDHVNLFKMILDEVHDNKSLSTPSNYVAFFRCKLFIADNQHVSKSAVIFQTLVKHHIKCFAIVSIGFGFRDGILLPRDEAIHSVDALLLWVKRV